MLMGSILHQHLLNQFGVIDLQYAHAKILEVHQIAELRYIRAQEFISIAPKYLPA